ncbi:hypothetical protein JCM11641_003409 [Rhodosporidiobolus odoratus]
MPLAPPTVTRDLIHYRKLPPRQISLLNVCDSYLSLLSNTDHPAGGPLRTAFLPALIGSDNRPRDATLLARLDEQLVSLFRTPPAVVLLQTVPTAEQVDHAWRADEGGMRERVFLAFALQQEMERATEENAREEVANLSMLIIASLTYELAQWISVKVRGFRPVELASDTASMRTTTTGVSVSSFHSTGSGGPLVPHRNNHDVGIRAVMALLGCDYELLSYSIGDRQLVKRRYPTRRSPVLTPPTVYFLIGDTPAILDATNFPPTTAGMIPPHKGEDSMCAIASVLTPSGVTRMHGECLLLDTGGGAASSAGGSSSQVHLVAGGVTGPAGSGDEEKVFDGMYRGL